MENKEEKDLKKVVISEKTLAQMTPEFLEKLKQEDNVKLVVIGNDMICDVKRIAHQENASIIILNEEEKQELIEQKMIEEENEKRIFEIKDLPHVDIQDAKYLYMRSERKQKFYVPRIIGRANSKKKGGR